MSQVFSNTKALTDDPAVVSHIAMQHGHAHIDDDIVTALVQQQTAKHFHAMGVDVQFMEVIQAGVAADLEFLDTFVSLPSPQPLASVAGLTGPTRRRAPAAFALWIDSMIRERLPSHYERA